MSFEDRLSELKYLAIYIQPVGRVDRESKRSIGPQKHPSSHRSLRTAPKDFLRLLHVPMTLCRSLCEYNIVPKLLNLPWKGVATLQVLEVFNLLLANSSKGSTLVYLFSQPSLHDFLF